MLNITILSQLYNHSQFNLTNSKMAFKHGGCSGSKEEIIYIQYNPYRKERVTSLKVKKNKFKI